MTSALADAIRLLTSGSSLSAAQTADAFGIIMRGEATPAQTAGLLIGLRVKGETGDEIAGAAQALRHAMVSIHPEAGPPLVDTCGTGGGAVATFNISTAAGFVTAGAGLRVAKHGNRSFTSKCGSADVLEALGVDITIPPERAALILDRVGMVFLFAPTYHPAMRHVGPTRADLAVPTIMNLLGPLANPAGVKRQVIGVADRSRAPLMADALARLGVEHVLVVHAEVGMDEISPTGRTQMWEVREGAVTTWALDPARYGLAAERLDELRGGDPPANAGRIERLLAGQAGPEERAVVVLNAAAAIYVSGLEPTFARASERARAALESGAARKVLDGLRQAAPRG